VATSAACLPSRSTDSESNQCYERSYSKDERAVLRKIDEHANAKRPPQLVNSHLSAILSYPDAKLKSRARTVLSQSFVADPWNSGEQALGSSVPSTAAVERWWGSGFYRPLPGGIDQGICPAIQGQRMGHWVMEPAGRNQRVGPEWQFFQGRMQSSSYSQTPPHMRRSCFA